MKKLPREKQCKNCPWKVSVDINTIPNGYDSKAHDNLLDNFPSCLDFESPLYVMACHHSNDKDNMYCVGWLHNQLGEGNNIPLRIKMMEYDLKNLKVHGEQHKNFKDLKPK